jgi:hypothetical protein
LIGIFQGKKEEYNKLILKALVSGRKTTKQLAEYIYLNRKQKPKPIEHASNEVKTLVSIISRKDSRLSELEDKNYIKREKNLWDLTTKGFPVALTLFNSISEILPYVEFESLSKMLDKIHEIPVIDAFLSNKKLKEIENLGKSPQFLQHMKDCTNELISKGSDSDTMSLEEFNIHLVSKVSYLLLKDMGAFGVEGVRP